MSGALTIGQYGGPSSRDERAYWSLSEPKISHMRRDEVRREESGCYHRCQAWSVTHGNTGGLSRGCRGTISKEICLSFHIPEGLQLYSSLKANYVA